MFIMAMKIYQKWTLKLAFFFFLLQEHGRVLVLSAFICSLFCCVYISSKCFITAFKVCATSDEQIVFLVIMVFNFEKFGMICLLFLK